MNETSLTNEGLNEAIAELEERKRQVQANLATLQQDGARLAREHELLSELAEIRDSENGGVQNRPGAVSPPPRGVRGPSRAGELLRTTAHEILSESGAPMYVSDLMEAVRGRGVAIPGAGNTANLTAHITRDPRVERVKRGWYRTK